MLSFNGNITLNKYEYFRYNTFYFMQWLIINIWGNLPDMITQIHVCVLTKLWTLFDLGFLSGSIKCDIVLTSFAIYVHSNFMVWQTVCFASMSEDTDHV